MQPRAKDRRLEVLLTHGHAAWRNTGALRAVVHPKGGLMTVENSSAVQLVDRVRQVTVLVGGALAIVGAAWGSGAFGGTPIAQAADGALASDATVLAPASPAFSIWSLIYAALVVYGIYQALPGNATDKRLRNVGWWILGSMLLNVAWILVVQAGSVWGSFVVIVALVVVLARIV